MRWSSVLFQVPLERGSDLCPRAVEQYTLIGLGYAQNVARLSKWLTYNSNNRVVVPGTDNLIAYDVTALLTTLFSELASMTHRLSASS